MLAIFVTVVVVISCKDMFTRHNIFTTTEKQLAGFLLRGELSPSIQEYTHAVTHIYTYTMTHMYLEELTGEGYVVLYIYIYIYSYTLSLSMQSYRHLTLMACLLISGIYFEHQLYWEFAEAMKIHGHGDVPGIFFVVVYFDSHAFCFFIKFDLRVSSSVSMYMYLYTLYYTDQRHYPGTPGGNSLSLIPN